MNRTHKIHRESGTERQALILGSVRGGVVIVFLVILVNVAVAEANKAARESF
jgi:hypothetical protein